MDFLKYGDIGIEDLNTIEISSEDLPDHLDNDVKDFDKSKKRKLLISSRKKYDKNNTFVEDESFYLYTNLRALKNCLN